MRGPIVRPIVIAAGGTGGHFFPAEALAATLIARGRRVMLMTDARSGATRSPVFGGGEVHVLHGAGIAGRGAVRSIKALGALAAGTVQARAVLARSHPAAVVAFGGYPSVAPVLATRLLAHRPPVILHEQNAVLGRANRFLSRHARMLALSFPQTEKLPSGATFTITGNPVRPAIAALAAIPYAPPRDGEINLLVLGGSLGARIMSQAVPAALAELPDALRSRLRVVQQCRAEDLDAVRASYAASNITAILAPFFENVADLLGRAHLVIARAGASTIAELEAAGRPAILIPLPTAIDDHQRANARALETAGGAWMMEQTTLTPHALASRIAALLSDPDGLAEAARRAGWLGATNAAERLANLVETTIRPRTAPGIQQESEA